MDFKWLPAISAEWKSSLYIRLLFCFCALPPSPLGEGSGVRPGLLHRLMILHKPIMIFRGSPQKQQNENPPYTFVYCFVFVHSPSSLGEGSGVRLRQPRPLMILQHIFVYGWAIRHSPFSILQKPARPVIQEVRLTLFWISNKSAIPASSVRNDLIIYHFAFPVFRPRYKSFTRWNDISYQLCFFIFRIFLKFGYFFQ